MLSGSVYTTHCGQSASNSPWLQQYLNYTCTQQGRFHNPSFEHNYSSPPKKLLPWKPPAQLVGQGVSPCHRPPCSSCGVGVVPPPCTLRSRGADGFISCLKPSETVTCDASSEIPGPGPGNKSAATGTNPSAIEGASDLQVKRKQQNQGHGQGQGHRKPTIVTMTRAKCVQQTVWYTNNKSMKQSSQLVAPPVLSINHIQTPLGRNQSKEQSVKQSSQQVVSLASINHVTKPAAENHNTNQSTNQSSQPVVRRIIRISRPGTPRTSSKQNINQSINQDNNQVASPGSKQTRVNDKLVSNESKNQSITNPKGFQDVNGITKPNVKPVKNPHVACNESINKSIAIVTMPSPFTRIVNLGNQFASNLGPHVSNNQSTNQSTFGQTGTSHVTRVINIDTKRDPNKVAQHAKVENHHKVAPADLRHAQKDLHGSQKVRASSDEDHSLSDVKMARRRKTSIGTSLVKNKNKTQSSSLSSSSCSKHDTTSDVHPGDKVRYIPPSVIHRSTSGATSGGVSPLHQVSLAVPRTALNSCQMPPPTFHAYKQNMITSQLATMATMTHGNSCQVIQVTVANQKA